MNLVSLSIASSKVWHSNRYIFDLVWNTLIFRSNLEISSVLFLFFWSVTRTNFPFFNSLSIFPIRLAGNFSFSFVCPCIYVYC